MIKRAMILAAGFGKRIHPLTLTCPKPLLKIGNSTLLSNTIKFLEVLGIKEITINVHYLADQIINYINKESKQGYPTSKTHPKIYNMIESTGILDFTAIIMAQQPGDSFFTHLDTIQPVDSGQEIRYHSDVEIDHDTHRFFIALEDWKWGHFFQVGNFNWHQWKAGDTLWYDWRHMPHSTANAGQKPRYLLKVSGKWPNGVRWQK